MYPSKILLFGEYSILLNSDALAIPFNRFKGELSFPDAQTVIEPRVAEQSNLRLKELFSFINKADVSNRFEFPFDFESFCKDLEKGLWFKSDIPEESGLGSSGALVAALFHRYTNISFTKTEIPKIKYDLALLESFFHGKSSGIDPLVSLLKSPLLIRGNEVSKISSGKIERTLHKYGLFLVFSSRVSATGELVEKFRTRCKSDLEYLKKINKNYIPVNNSCISIVLDNSDPEIFFPVFRDLAILQSELLKNMIPENYSLMINDGLLHNLFYTKLCGSGGGGYFMGFTKNINETNRYFKTRGCKILVY
jgi:mevalonate kinase